MKRFLYILPVLAYALLQLGCAKCDCPEEGYEPGPSSRTILVYLAMNNSLGREGIAMDNINAMVSGATRANMNEGRIIVFHDDQSEGTPRLLEIYAGEDGAGTMRVLKTYNNTEQDASLTATFLTAIDDMKEFAPSESYALILGSHGTGWMPSGMHTQYAVNRGYRSLSAPYGTGWEKYIRDPFGPLPETRAMLQERPNNSYDHWMEIDELAGAIPANLFDFIILDMCYMGGVETGYALSQKTDYIVFSPAEVVINGMPYDRIISSLFSDTPILGDNGVCEIYYRYYLENHSSGSATTTLIDCSAYEAFASVMNDILMPKAGAISAMTEGNIGSNYMFYDRHTHHTMFDLRELVYSLYGDGDPLRAAFDTAMGNLIEYKATTGRMFSLSIPANRYSGLSTYIPIAGYENLNVHYRQTAWYNRVYLPQ